MISSGGSRNSVKIETPLKSATTIALHSDQLDLISVTKASQTISGVMVREELLRTLLRLVLEASGARRALILLAHEGRFELAGEVASEEVDGARTAAPRPGHQLPRMTIVAYVERTQETVLLADARSDTGRFSRDPYMLRSRPRSVLCLPIRRQAELVALLYLENDMVPGAFTPERLVALELLASQAAFCLEMRSSSSASTRAE